MKPTGTRKAHKKGLLTQPDDFQVGQFYAVYSLKHEPDEPFPVCGQAFKLTALNLPFLVGKLVSDPAHAPLTLDVRFLQFMPVTEDYVEAQRPAPSASTPSSAIN